MTTSNSDADAAAGPGTPPPHLLHDDPLLACLVEVTRLLGTPYTAQSLVVGLPLVEQRLTPSLLPRAAARAQCSARLLRRSLRDLPEGVLPAILLLKNGRACVLLEMREDGCLVHYPEAAAPVTVPAEMLREQYSGVACFVQPKFRFEARVPQSDKGPTRHWFWSVVFENRRLYRDALFAAVLVNLFALAMPLFTMNVYDRVVPSKAVETLWVLASGIALIIVFNYILTTARSYVVDTASKRIDVKLSAQIMERVLDLRMEQRPASVGSFAANLRSFETIRDFIASASLTTLVDLPFVFLFLFVLAWISPYMLVPPLVAIVLVLIVSWVAQRRMQRLTIETFQAAAQRNATLVESLGGLDTLKTLNAQGSAQQTWERNTRFLAHVGGKIKLISSINVGFVQMLSQLVTVAVVVIGVYLVQEAMLSLGGIIAASMIAGRCLQPLGQVAGLMMQYQNARTSLGSIDNYMKMDVERPETKEFVPRPTLKGSLEFRNVAFTYPGSRQAALSRINIKIEAGERVGIIGRIGSGKSTLEKLILGLYAPTQGTVLVDGIDVSQIDPSDLRRNIGYVPQDPILFYGNLRHNLTLGAPFAEADDMLGVARVAGLEEFVNQHPQGYDMPIGERGDSLSGGQRQSVAVARALINNPPILLLDEPSSNMDNQSESRLRAQLRKVADGKTLILVTHRTALLELVDRIIVIDGGTVVADGPKAQVVEALRHGRIGRAGAAA